MATDKNLDPEKLFILLMGILKKDETSISQISSLLNLLNPDSFSLSQKETFKKILQKLTLLESRIETRNSLTTNLYEATTIDDLTQFKNRRYLDKVLKPKLEKISNLAYMMVDIDKFHDYNESYGHIQGDVAIRNVCDMIRDNVKTELLIRYGGEEFAIMIVGYQDKNGDLEEKGEKIRKAVEENIVMPFSNERIGLKLLNKIGNIEEEKDSFLDNLLLFFSDKNINSANYYQKLGEYFTQQQKLKDYITKLQRVTISIGGASRNEGEDLDALIDRTDEALYLAKTTRNAVVIAK